MSRPAAAARHHRAVPWRFQALATSHAAVAMSRVYSASEPAPRAAGSVASPGASAATHAVAIPPVSPPSRRPSPASGRTSSVPLRQVRTTTPVWGSSTTWLVTPNRNGTNGGKCSSAWPSRWYPSPSTSAMPERR
jgi:hypothetical protein